MYELQSTLEEKVNPSHLKNDFSSRTDASIFTSIAPVSLDWSNKTSSVFPVLKSTRYFLVCLVDQIQVQKPIPVVATDQIPENT